MSQALSDSVSCIVVNYFCAQQTLEAVKSFSDQCPHGQVVVVDNSADAQEFQALRQGLPSGALLIPQPENTGFAVACNTALAHCDKSFVLLLNPDAILLPDCVSQLAQCLQSNDALAAASPLQFWDRDQRWMLPPAWLPTGTGHWALTVAAQSNRSALRMSRAYRALALKLWKPESENVIQQRALSGGALMLRHSVLRDLGQLFDPAYFMYFEDSDLCLRLRRKGWKLAIARNAGVVHEWEHSSSKIQMMEKSRGHYFASHFSGRGAWEKRLEKASPKGCLDNPLEAVGLVRGTPSIDVPLEWQDAWILEASPSPLLTPALGLIGSGATANIDWHLMKRMGEQSRIFLRLGSVDDRLLNAQTYVVDAQGIDQHQS